MTIAAELSDIPTPGHPRNRLATRVGRLSVAGSSRLRSVVQDPFSSENGSSQLAVTAILVLPAWIALAIAAALVPASAGGTLTSPASARILEMFAGELAVAAALLSFMKAWAAREVAPALIGGAFAVYGIRTLLELNTSSSQEPSPASAGQAVGTRAWSWRSASFSCRSCTSRARGEPATPLLSGFAPSSSAWRR